MNKKYKADSEGNLFVITDSGEKIEREDKYTKNTDLILSLENIIESLEKKKDYFKDELSFKKTEYTNKKKNIIGCTIASALVLSFLILIYSILSIKVLLIFISTWALSYFSALIPDLLENINNKKEIEEYQRKIKIESHKIDKLNKRIEALSKDKEVIKQQTDNYINMNKIDNYIDVKQISNYYDVSDYFIMNYIIDKNTKKENPSKKKIRKLTKEDNRTYKM